MNTLLISFDRPLWSTDIHNFLKDMFQVEYAWKPKHEHDEPPF